MLFCIHCSCDSSESMRFCILLHPPQKTGSPEQVSQHALARSLLLCAAVAYHRVNGVLVILGDEMDRDELKQLGELASALWKDPPRHMFHWCKSGRTWADAQAVLQQAQVSLCRQGSIPEGFLSLAVAIASPLPRVSKVSC